MACRLAGAKWSSEPMLEYIVNWTLDNKFQLNLSQILYIIIQENAFENVVSKIAAILSRSQCVNLIWLTEYLEDRECTCDEVQVVNLNTILKKKRFVFLVI